MFHIQHAAGNRFIIGFQRPTPAYYSGGVCGVACVVGVLHEGERRYEGEVRAGGRCGSESEGG